ncbi:RNA polymerase sigma-70 factor, ECF subfamily [Serinicoccus hydrothermalis]|uniref:RNA polymerase sigma-70 factor, ECF subfamily n=1 Tax=Serinicoccus hydrothermalis TaxID=1758689 RepID=A0A1B1NDS7_9MICO|nr:sigma-70 family RNA polymerase sigma factor [Serinicoccus hydrothermalis]ANS79576.1 RNA polymerase sigma-70 factor, ECF subfamily [Serinicoccus hydrothermalis]
MSTQVEAPRADFEESTAPLRGELIAHCYRMLGSASEAEDLVQETYLRAWKAYHRFEGRSSVRTWMYTIATNACLTALKQQGRRPLPSGLGGPPGDPREPVVEDRSRDWLEPLPDQLVWGRDAVPVDPAEATEAAEATQLAFVAALQDLPPLQRAVLVLREVLQLSAAETASVLETTVASVNSALQRSRATIGEGLSRAGRRVDELTPADRAVFAAFCEAFERHDIPAVVAVMTDQATWQMPPFDRYYLGPADIAALVEHQCPAKVAGDLRMVPVVANGQPAVGMYLRGPDGAYRRFQLCVVDLRDGEIHGVVGFFDGSAFEHAGLPEDLPAG